MSGECQRAQLERLPKNLLVPAGSFIKIGVYNSIQGSSSVTILTQVLGRLAHNIKFRAGDSRVILFKKAVAYELNRALKIVVIEA